MLAPLLIRAILTNLTQMPCGNDTPIGLNPIGLRF